MSRIGKKPVPVPEKTTVTINGAELSVKGPLGELKRRIDQRIGITVDGAIVNLVPHVLTNETKALWGTTAAHLKNMIKGVHTAYEKKLIIEGVGFKSDIKGDTLNMTLGFSHPVAIKIPAGLKVVSEKGVITITGIDKESVGQFAAVVRSWKKPEPYKGKGIRYSDEVIRRKQGKKAA